MGAVVALDQLCDLAFDARGGLAQPFAGMPDILAFRAALRAHSPALGLVMDLGAAAKDGPWLEVVDWQVAPQDMGALPVVDLMVSLYGGGQVPRLAVAQAGKAIVLVQSLFDQVIADLKALMPMVSGQR